MAFLTNKQLKLPYLFPALLLTILLAGLASCTADDEDPDKGNWIRQSDFEGVTRSGAVVFVIDDLAYVGLGFDGDDYLKDFWQYDPSLNFWQRVDTFPGIARIGAVAFSVDGKGYVGTGFDGDADEELTDFWAFDPQAPSGQQWTRRADFGGTARYNAVAFAIGGKGYVGTGFDGNYLKDFWQYDPATDSWSQTISIGGSKRESAAAFVIDGRAYVGTGRNNGAYEFDFWEFDPATETKWRRLLELDEDNDYNIIRHGAVGFSIGGRGYIATGSTGATLSTVWEYEPGMDVWEERTPFEGASRLEAVGFTVADRAFLTTGRSGSARFDDLYEFRPDEEYDEDD